MSIECDGCSKEITEGYNPTGNKLYCSDCFWKKVKRYLKHTGLIPLTLADFKSIFDNVRELKTRQLKAI